VETKKNFPSQIGGGVEKIKFLPSIERVYEETAMVGGWCFHLLDYFINGKYDIKFLY